MKISRSNGSTNDGPPDQQGPVSPSTPPPEEDGVYEDAQRRCDPPRNTREGSKNNTAARRPEGQHETYRPTTTAPRHTDHTSTARKCGVPHRNGRPRPTRPVTASTITKRTVLHRTTGMDQRRSHHRPPSMDASRHILHRKSPSSGSSSLCVPAPFPRP